MPTFRTNPVRLEELLRDCERGEVKLPDFQRSWVWDEDRIVGLIASVSRAFPVGALMTLQTGGDVRFKERPIQGAPAAAEAERARYLLLDGQQRMTSLYQTCMRGEVVETITAKKRKVHRWFYLDIAAALAPDVDRESAIIGLPEDRILRENFARDVKLDLSTTEREYAQAMFPVHRVFDWDEWQDGFGDYWIGQGDPDKRQLFRRFKDEVLQNFKSYQVPVIELDRDTSRAAVCLVFEKVNTGGKPLDAFELVTATYATEGFELRRDWGEAGKEGRQPRLARFGRAAGERFGLLEKVASTDFLQAIALRHSKALRMAAEAGGKQGRELPPISATRQSLLDLPLAAYRTHADGVEVAFQTAAKFLRLQNVLHVRDLPYQSQLVPLAAILDEIGDRWEHLGVRDKLARWYWCGVFGELYGSATESRFARDMAEVPAWLDGGPEPITVQEGVLRADRLDTMRSRLSAAYKGVQALLMRDDGARDFRSGQAFDQTVFFDESVDIHHVFPRAWCRRHGIDEGLADSIVNKTPLSARTNRIIGGDAPSLYLARLERGNAEAPPIEPNALDDLLRSHRIEPAFLRADDFHGFFQARKASLLALIETATGRQAYVGQDAAEPGEQLSDETATDDAFASAAS